MADDMKVLVVGASGLVGHAAVRAFAAVPGWEVHGWSRRTPRPVPGAEFLAVDLDDADACANAVAGITDVTHVVYAAVVERPGLVDGWFDDELIRRNTAMLRNLFEPLLRSATSLRHVSLLQGTKAYGVHHPTLRRDRVRLPLRERDPRIDHPNFYFAQEDYLRDRQRTDDWELTILRPTVVYGDTAGVNMNPLLPLAVYAALLRDQGRDLDFPGDGDLSALHEAVDADLVGRALVWAATSASAAGCTFNVTNGDVFSWGGVWPAIADALGMAAGERRPVTLAAELPRRAVRWRELVAEHGLRSSTDVVELLGVNSIVYADMMLGTGPPGPPLLNSTIAIRQAGFAECLDTEDMFVTLLRRLAADRLIPPP